MIESLGRKQKLADQFIPCVPGASAELLVAVAGSRPCYSKLLMWLPVVNETSTFQKFYTQQDLSQGQDSSPDCALPIT